MEHAMDPWSAVVDEVTLEGLDGITVPSLWIRLESRQPEFSVKLDDSTKEFIWKLLIDNTELTFYELPKEREDVVLSDRFKDADEEKIPCAHEQKKDIYPIHIIIKDGIQGSCAFFNERTDITKHVRSTSNTALITLDEALKRYGRKLVVVASQALRFRALIGNESDPDLKLTDDSFCVLERVARGRWQGELQNELHGSTFKADARKLHYMRKSLVNHGLISMQPFVSRKKTGQQQHSILLILKRFHVNRRSKYDILMEYMSNILQHLPEQRGTISSFKEQLNLSDGAFKRVCRHMRDAKLVEFVQCPLEELDPSAGPCTTKKGNKVRVRCMRLIKPYSKKGVTDDDEDDDDNDEDVPGARSRVYPPQGRIMERDVLTQAYHIILAAGTKGVPQTGLGFRLNIGKLESRMLCRRLERDGLIKGFMVDEGRQRTTKFISHKCVGLSDQLQLFAQEQERKMLLFSSEPQASDAAAAAPKTPSPSKSTAKGNNKTPAAKKTQKAGRAKGAKEAEQTCSDVGMDKEKEKGRGKSAAKGKTRGRKSNVTADQMETETAEATPAEDETPACSEPSTSMDTSDDLKTEQAEEEEQQSNQTPAADPLPQSSASVDRPVSDNIVVVKDVWENPKGKSKKSSEKSHETYRLLRRKNLIVEAVRSRKIIEGLFPLQKMINDEEKQFGFTSKCCKKTITRLIRSLSREGLLRMYTTTVIQDGITKKVEMIVHPSVQPNDEIVQRVIEQVRFRISSSYSNVRLQHEEKLRELDEFEDVTPEGNSKAEKKASMQIYNSFKPTTVPGLGKTFGFQPKMHRLRLVHNFLWYLIYGHPLGRATTVADCVTSKTPAKPASSDPEAKCSDEHEKQDPKDSAAQPQGANSKLDETSGEDEEEKKEESAPVCPQPELKVYADEESWKRFIPPVRVHKEFTSGWAMVADMLLCLPLSIFIQVIQINYKVEGLEEYLNDPLKQHYLVRWLPPKMRRQLLYRRKYLFSFHENLQKLAYMGLLQFGPSEKFMEKDQVFVYLKRHTTIVDTTNAEPHYWKIQETPDKPFERRQYTFNTYEDIENYWFDLMCVCLNTPLGVVRSRRRVQASEDNSAPEFVPDRYVFLHLAYLLKGSREVCDDGSVPGDGKGAAGLDCEFFAHLKRNWLWTNHLLAARKKSDEFESTQKTNRLKSLLSKHALRIALKAGGATAPRYLTIKKPAMTENVEVDIEPASRNQRVVGGKKQKRKRIKKDVVKVARKKKKEPKKRTPAHDEADHRALKMMTRQRVYWSIQEDSLMMLCSVASQLLNSKLKRPFIPYCVVRDLLQAEFEISMDKTSLAVGRRTRYILKNPQTLLNFRICLAEVYQDKSLMKLLEEKKPADPDKPEDCAEAFSEYARLLRQKFSSVINAGKMNMPDSKRQLFSRYKVSAIESRRRVPSTDTLNSTEDIHTIVLHNLIQSTLAMTNHQMKSSRSFQTFHMYSKYDQELLCQVFVQCRKRGLVNRRRVSQPLGPKKNRALPILPMSFQLSQSYYRCFSWRFPHSLCTDSFRFLRNLINSGMRDDRPLTEFHHQSELRVEGVARGSKRKDKQGGEKAEDGAAKEPESVDGVETVVNDEVMNKTDSEEKNPEEECVTAGAGEDSSSTEQQSDDQPPEDKPPNTAAEDPPDLLDMVQFSLDSAGGACVASLSLMALGLLSVHLSIPKQMVVVDSNLVDNDIVKSIAALEEEDDDDYDGEECEGRKKLEVKAHQASHTNYLMMRGYCCPGIVKIRNLNTNDNIVVESCTMKLQLRNTPAHNIFSTENSPPLDLSKCGPSLLPSILTHSICSTSPPSSSCSVEECDGRLIERGYTPQDMEACARLRRILGEAGENGLDVCDLHQVDTQQEELQAGCTRSLQQYMKDLQEENHVVKVGGQGHRWVLTQHAEPWLLTLNTNQWSQSYFKSHSMPFLEKEHNIPFMRKRCRAESQQRTEEPPSKKPAVDREGGEHSESVQAEEGSGDITGEEANKEAQLEKQKEAVEGGSGDKELDLGEEEGGQQTSQEEGEKEDAGQEKMEEGKEDAGEEKMQEDKDVGAEKMQEDGEDAGEEKMEEEKEDTEQDKMGEENEDAGEEKTEEDKEDVGQEEMEEGAGEEKMETEEGQKETTRRVTRARRRNVRADRDEEASSPLSAGEYVSFVSRPWRVVDGTLNRQVCKGMLEGVMHHIMYRPGLTQQALVEHYKYVLQPVVVLDLVQALIDMGCVTKKTVVKSPKPSLFNRSKQLKESEAEAKIKKPEGVFYEPTISCCLRLSQVLPNERHWNNSAPSKPSTPH